MIVLNCSIIFFSNNVKYSEHKTSQLYAALSLCVIYYRTLQTNISERSLYFILQTSFYIGKMFMEYI